MSKLALEVYKSISSVSSIEIKSEEEKLKRSIVGVLKKNMEEEAELDKAVHAMMDQLDKQNPGSFERYKMFPMLKKKLAEQRGFVL